MFARIKNVFSNWREDRRRLRALLIQLETLTDPTFLDRALLDNQPLTYTGKGFVRIKE